MAVYTEPPAVVTGQTMTATNWNDWVRTNFQALWPFTAAGQIALSSAANQLTKLDAIGNSGKVIQSNGTTFTLATMSQLISDLRRKGGSATDWYAQGTTNYAPSSAKLQMGTARIAVSGGSGSVAITFPTAFAYKPVVFISKPYDGSNWDDFGFSAITASGFSIYIQQGGTGTINVDVTWLAIGP
ncbi:MAG: H-type lectin domain-containing protein [Chloroflexota bacterium]